MQHYIWLLWDLLAVLLIVFCIYSCARRGLLRTLVGFLSYFISAVAARLLSVPLAQLLYRHIVRDAMVLYLNGRVEELLLQGQEMTGIAADLIPGLLGYLLTLTGEAQTGLELVAGGTDALVNGIIDTALEGPILFLLQGVCFMLVFSVASMATRWIARLFSGIYRVPVLGTINTVAGGIIGVLQAVLFLFIGSFAIAFAIYFTGDTLEWLNTSVVNDTFIWRVFFRAIDWR